MQQTIIKAANGLLSIVLRSSTHSKEIELIDEQIALLESAIKVIQSNWISKEDRLKRAKEKLAEAKAEVKWLGML